MVEYASFVSFGRWPLHRHEVFQRPAYKVTPLKQDTPHPLLSLSLQLPQRLAISLTSLHVHC